jgi:uncharacterized HAD superfamily protein
VVVRFVVDIDGLVYQYCSNDPFILLYVSNSFDLSFWLADFMDYP